MAAPAHTSNPSLIKSLSFNTARDFSPISCVMDQPLLIAVHEYGHYRMAVACGVRVLRFSIGFGPVLWRWKPRHPRPHQDTEFVVCAIPLGGYVRMLDDTEGPVSELDQPYEYQRKPLACRAAIVLLEQLTNGSLLAHIRTAGAHLEARLRGRAAKYPVIT